MTAALVKYLCCKTEHKTQLNFSKRQKILKCLWSKNFQLQKSGHTGKSNYGLNLSIILMFLTFYGVENRSVTAANIIMINNSAKNIIFNAH